MKKMMLICFLLVGVTAVSIAKVKAGLTDPVEKAKGLQKQLTLTDAQTTKVANIYKESAAKYDVIKTKADGNTNKMLAPVKALRKATVAKIKVVLTPAQVAKYTSLIKNSKQGGGAGWSDGWSSASGN